MNHSQLSFNRTASAGGSPAFNQLHTASMVLSAATQGPAAIAADLSEAGRCFHAAVALYEAAQWRKSYSMLAKLADGGHAAAARLALLMLRYGAPLYGAAFTAAPKQIARWATQVLRDARERATDPAAPGSSGPSGQAAAKAASESTPNQTAAETSGQASKRLSTQTIALPQRFDELDSVTQGCDVGITPQTHAWQRFQAAANDDFADDSGFTASRVTARPPLPSRGSWTGCIA